METDFLKQLLGKSSIAQCFLAYETRQSSIKREHCNEICTKLVSEKSAHLAVTYGQNQQR